MHPSTWDPKHGGHIRRPEIVPVWKFCLVCKLVAAADAAGPPEGKDAKGWRIVLERANHSHTASLGAVQHHGGGIVAASA